MNEALIAKIAEAIDSAEVGYSLSLTRLVDGEHTYTLTYSDGNGPYEFGDIHDGYGHIRDRKSKAQAEAVITALGGKAKKDNNVRVIKHTPGPWAPNGDQVEVQAVHNDGYRICDVFGPDYKANAHLVSAAPELLQALKEICDRVGPRWFLEQNWAAPLDAIAKAEGRQ